MKQSGIKHLTGAPYNPETNGQTESAVKIMKKAILKGKADGIDYINLIINRFLFQYRNTQLLVKNLPNHYLVVTYAQNLI